MVFLKRFQFIRQHDQSDCGPACLAMICSYHGQPARLQTIKRHKGLTRQGVSLERLSLIAEKLGFKSVEVRTSLEKIRSAAPLPFIAHWNGDHFVVVYKITDRHVYMADPGKGKRKLSLFDFNQGWAYGQIDGKGLALLLQPTRNFFMADEQSGTKSNTIPFLTKYLWQYRLNVLQIIAGLFLGSIIQIILPFLTQAIVDKGILPNDTSLIYWILLLQIVLYISATGIEFMRTWVFMHLSTRVNVFIISDFLSKLMRLPVDFFDARTTGDLTQRIQDHKRIEQFITDTLIKSLFSVFTLLVFGFILWYFNLQVFMIYLVFTTLQLSWIFFFLKKLRLLDYESFALMAKDNSKIYEIINGMQEIKLNNLQQAKRTEWQRIQQNLFSVSLRKLKINQLEQGGTRFMNYAQIILIIFFSAISVIHQQMTLGTMMSILFIVGQMNAPVSQLINFILSTQMARISLSRMGEVQQHPEEGEGGLTRISGEGNITINGLSFSYTGDADVLQGVNVAIPANKVTAIVGVSGSGKTTLLRLLLKFYEPGSGSLFIDDVALKDIDSNYWRTQCGTVLQDSYIFSETIAYNIALQQEYDPVNLTKAAKAANIEDFVHSLPMGYTTRIGQEGFGISGGQRQRILIARAIYKNPKYLFFDEATNALDARNEHIIMQNLQQFFCGRTVVVVAHRLSTIKNADQIIVMQEGTVVETGNHTQLMAQGGYYRSLVRHQLDLGAQNMINIVDHE